jgi:hypothetical protein
MRSLQAPLSLLIVVATTLPGWLAADGVQLPDAILPYQSKAARNNDLLAQGDEAHLQRPPATQRRPQTNELEISRTDRTGRSAEVKVSSPTGNRAAPSPDSEGVRPQVVITDQQPAGAERSNRQPARRVSPASMASALFPEQVSSTNPYGDINDTRGIRPYKPGVRYDRQMEDDRDSSVFGMLFGR